MRSVPVGDTIDCLDTIGRWYRATLLAAVRTQTSKEETTIQDTCKEEPLEGEPPNTNKGGFDNIVRVTEKTNRVLVRYDGWPTAWDEWVEDGSLRLAPVGTHPNTIRLFHLGDLVKIGDWSLSGRGTEAFGRVKEVRQMGSHKVVTVECVIITNRDVMQRGGATLQTELRTARYAQYSAHYPLEPCCQCVHCHIRLISPPKPVL